MENRSRTVLANEDERRAHQSLKPESYEREKLAEWIQDVLQRAIIVMTIPARLKVGLSGSKEITDEVL